MEDREQVCRVIDAYLSIFGNKWNLLILNELFNGPKRFNELKRALDPITQTVLTRHLKLLEEMDVVERTVISESPPSVYYAISKEGFSVIPSMIASYNWIIQHVPELKQKRTPAVGKIIDEGYDDGREHLIEILVRKDGNVIVRDEAPRTFDLPGIRRSTSIGMDTYCISPSAS